MSSVYSRAYFLFILLVSAFYAFWVIPHVKGLDLSDAGYQLYYSKSMLYGVVPAEGFGFIFNSILMFFGGKSYLFFEQMFLLLTVVAVQYFLFSVNILKNKGLHYVAAGVFVLIAINMNINSLLYYGNAPQVYLLIALGCLFQFMDCQNSKMKLVLCFIASVMLSLSTFSNLSLLPTFFSSLVFIMLILRKDKYIKIYCFSYVLTSGVLLLCYLYSPFSLFHSSEISGVNAKVMKAGSEGFQLSFFLLKLKTMISVIFSKSLLYVLSFFILIRVGFYLLGDRLKGVDYHKIVPYMFVFFVIFISYRSLDVNHSPLAFLMFFGVLGVRVLILALVMFFSKSMFRERVYIAGIIVLSYAVCLSLTSSPTLHLAMFGASSFIVSFLIFDHFLGGNDFHLAKWLLVLILVILSLFNISYYMNLTYRGANINQQKYLLKNSILGGVYVSKEKRNFITQITRLYDKNNCQQKKFVAYSTLPLLYYYFNKRAPYDIPWIGGGFISISAERLVDVLTSYKHACVVVAPNFFGYTGFQSDSASPEYRFNRIVMDPYNKVVLTYLKNRAKSKYKIVSPTAQFSPKETYFFVY